ncbi:MAG: helix-turn-helix transcriptional regulator [Rhodospirillales bacterium]|nr:helix-turn-helix transcriptional regulator [Rhodospirillales bacterium]
MSEPNAFDRILASMNEAMLDDDRWLPTAALIDDACRAKGNMLTIAEGRTQGNIEIFSVRLCLRGERRETLARGYFKDYFPRDERIPRLRRLPEGQVAYVPDLYTDEELRTSPAYNESLPRGSFQNGLNVRMDGPNGSRITWSAADPVDGDGWSASQLELVRHLLPHLRQYVRVRQALAEASALGATLSTLLDKTGTAIIQLGRGAQIVAANDRARDVLSRGDGLFDSGGFLCARLPKDNADLQHLLLRALPPWGGQGTSGSMTVRRFSELPRLVLHVSPVNRRDEDSFAAHIAALAVIVDAGSRTRIDRALVAESLDLTAAECHVAVSLAEGKTVRDIAAATGRKESTIHWHLRNIFNKHGISRQVELVQMVLSLARTPHTGQSNG